MFPIDATDPTTAPPVDQLRPPSAELLDQPLDYIFADHFRQRCLFSWLRRIAIARKAGRLEADTIVAYLEGDLVDHHADEELDLFPALRRRAGPEDGLVPILERLCADHETARTDLDVVVTSLSRHRTRDWIAVSRKAADAMLAYVANEQRHLSVENAIVLVIARKRLTASDLAAMSRSMKARRGQKTES